MRTINRGGKRMIKRARVVPLAIMTIGGLLAACGGGPAAPVTVNVTTTDFAFESSQTSFEVGVPYHFVVTNDGTVAHEFMIMEPMQGEGMDMEEMDELALVVIEEEDLEPGQTASADYTFEQAYPEGTLELACHVPGHYENGMRLGLVVK
jgi:uncharacterized cupredoxin-like copper-binding protein